MVGRLVLAQEIEVRPLAPQLTTYGGIVSLYDPGNPGASRRFAQPGQFPGQMHPGSVQAIQAILAGLAPHHAPGPEQPQHGFNPGHLMGYGGHGMHLPGFGQVGGDPAALEQIKQAILGILMQRRAQGVSGNVPSPITPGPNFNY